jgi:hypothetical protein
MYRNTILLHFSPFLGKLWLSFGYRIGFGREKLMNSKKALTIAASWK